MARRRSRATQPVQKLSDELGVLEQIAARGGEIRWSGSTRCPECGAYGIVDRVADGVQDNRCVSCDARWSFSAKAVALFLDAHEPGPADDISVVGTGVLVVGLAEDAAHVTRERFVGLKQAMRISRRVVIQLDD
jgi:hypothetical protein